MINLLLQNQKLTDSREINKDKVYLKKNQKIHNDNDTNRYLHWWLRNFLVIWWGISSFRNWDNVDNRLLPAVLQSAMNGSSCLKNSTHSSWSCVHGPPQLAGACSIGKNVSKAFSSGMKMIWKTINTVHETKINK